MRDWFKARNIWGAAILALPDEEAGRLAKALWTYTMTGEEIPLSGAERSVFAMIKMTLSQDDDKESEISSKRALAGALGGKQRVANKANASVANNTEAKEATATNKNKSKEKEQEKEQREAAFARFWSAYPRKEAKPKAHEAFLKINPNEELLAKMLSAIEKWKASDQWQEDGGKYIPHPTTWLNQQRWNDEPQQRKNASPVKQVVVAQQYEQRDYSGYQENPDDILDRIANGVLAG